MSGAPAVRPYPKHLEETVTLKDGDTVWLRPVRSGDEAAHARFFDRLDPQDVYFRFFSHVHKYDLSQIERYTRIDYDREMAFIAVREDASGSTETLGVVRAVTDASNLLAEYAIIVRPDLQGKGLGRALMEKVIRYCREKGTARLLGYILQPNSAMLRMAASLGFEIAHGSDVNVAIATLKLN